MLEKAQKDTFVENPVEFFLMDANVLNIYIRKYGLHEILYNALPFTIKLSNFLKSFYYSTCSSP